MHRDTPPASGISRRMLAAARGLVDHGYKAGLILALLLLVLFLFGTIPWVREQFRAWWHDATLQRDMAIQRQAVELENKGQLKAALEKYDLLIDRRKSDLSVVFIESRAQLFARLGRYDDALADFNTLVKLVPGRIELLLERAKLHGQREDWPAAQAECDRVIERLAARTERTTEEIVVLYQARQYRALVLGNMGHFDQALAELEALAERISLDRINHLYLAEIREWAGNHRRALEEYERAYTLREPDLSDEADSQTWATVAAALADFLATCPHAELRDGKRAREIAQKALERGGERIVDCAFALAAAHAELGEFADAIRVQEQYLGPFREDVNLEMQRQRLALYRQGRPWRRPVRR